MSQPPVPGPGYADQARKRTLFRIVGLVSMTIAVVLIGIAVADFFSAMGSDDFNAQPTKFWMFFAALPFFLVGGLGLNAGFVGAAARYGAGETAPVVKDTAAYLSDGQGVLGVGRTVDDQPAAGRFCTSCGAAVATGSRFCGSCGVAVT